MVEKAPGKPGKFWKIVLVLSLALNLAVVGLVAGVGLRAAGGKPPRNVDFGFGPIGQALSQEQRRSIGLALRDNPEIRQGVRRGAQMIEGLVTALRAPVVDEGALLEALDFGSGRHRAMQDAAKAAFIEEVGRMSEAERLAFADRLENLPRRRPKGN